MEYRAYVVSGAVIIADDLKECVKYHPQCPYCGTVMRETTCTGWIRHGYGNLGGCTCRNCHKGFSVQINRGC